MLALRARVGVVVATLLSSLGCAPAQPSRLPKGGEVPAFNVDEGASQVAKKRAERPVSTKAASELPRKEREVTQAEVKPQEPPPPCPADMVFVDAAHCPDSRWAKVGLRCTKKERNKPNNLTICHAFKPGQRCPTKERRQRFCIDRYEYPNKKGGSPPVMVSAFDAAALCKRKGKRLCFESEWVTACEGRDKWPFPYGHRRSKAHCNIDNPWKKPSLKRVYSKNRRVQVKELRRLDQSVRSGSMATCKSSFGVFDLTGNVDEWVLTEYRRGRSKWAGLKGGAWGHVRNACRTITTSHTPDFRYYFISFRCCKNAAARPNEEQRSGLPLWTPPHFEPPAPPAGVIDEGVPLKP